MQLLEWGIEYAAVGVGKLSMKLLEVESMYGTVGVGNWVWNCLSREL